MKFSEKELKVFSFIHMRSDASLSEVSSATGLKSHTVRFALQSLKESGILQPYVMINRKSLQYETFMVYFNIKPSFSEHRAKIIQALKSLDCCIWLGPMVGDFEYGMTLTFSSLDQVHTIFCALADQLGSFWSSKTLCIDRAWYYLGKKYLLNKTYFPAPLHINFREEKVSVDDADFQILKCLIGDPLGSDSEIAKKLNIPATTVHNRIKKLKSKNIIGGYIYGTCYSKASISAYRVLIDFGGMGDKLAKIFVAYAKSHPNIVQLNIVTGSYDIEMSVEFQGNQIIPSFVNELSNKFKKYQPVIKVLSRMDDLKWSMAGISVPAK